MPPEYVDVHGSLRRADRRERTGQDGDRCTRRKRSSPVRTRVGVPEPSMRLSRAGRRTEPVMRVTELVHRLRGAFLEVPGTRLSVGQAARLAGIEPSLCRHLLESRRIRTFSNWVKTARSCSPARRPSEPPMARPRRVRRLTSISPLPARF